MPPKIELWTRKFCALNAWRVKPLLDEEDLFQECAIKYVEVRARYRHEPKLKRKHLYMKSCRNLITRFANSG